MVASADLQPQIGLRYRYVAQTAPKHAAERNRSAARMIGKGVDDTYLDEVFELTDADFAPAETAAERLPVLTLDEAHTVLELLLHFGKGTDDPAESARRLAHEIAARIPSTI